MTIDRNCISYWFPRLCSADVNRPRTEILRLSRTENSDLQGLAYCAVHPDPVVDPYAPVLSFLRDAADKFGLPLFLRTGHGSGKHDWEHTCCLRSLDRAKENIWSLVQWCGEVDMLGLPTDVWAAREMLPVKPFFHCLGYGGMPVVTEWRFFARDGRIQCVHPYWPTDALEQGRPSAPDWRDALVYLHRPPPPEAVDQAVRAARAFEGYWSIDVLESTAGFFVTDMAEGDRSFHWPGCEAVPSKATEVTESTEKAPA